MTRFLRNLLIVDVAVALVIGLIGWSSDWEASDYTLALLVVSGLALFATAGAALGRSGPMSNVSGGAMTDPIGPGSVRGTPAGAAGGVFGMAVDDEATSEWVGSQYVSGPGSPKGDFFGRWGARQGEAPGPRTFFVMLATTLTTGAAALVSWMFFE
jgi:hypothetical protein